MRHNAAKKLDNALFIDFLTLLRDYGVPASPRDLLELNRGLEKGLVQDLDDLFVLTRLCFVRHVEHMDAFERAFALYFFGIDIPAVAEGDYALFETKQFKEWLEQMIERGELPERARWKMDPDELMKKFWETVREQMEAHHGGKRWIGTKGNSPFGHSGNSERGVRVDGQSGNRSALSVIGDRRYVEYSDQNSLRGGNIRQALEAMRHMQRVGSQSELNMDETIRRTVKNLGEIELAFDRELHDRMKLILMIDNGGESMLPHVDLTQLLFAKLHDRFTDITTYFFNNTIHSQVWKDDYRSVPMPLEKVLQKNPATRLVIIGDASMAPEELQFPYTYRFYDSSDTSPSLYWLRRLAERLPFSTWLNPIPKHAWETVYGNWTIRTIGEIFEMEDLTLGGIRSMAKRLSER